MEQPSSFSNQEKSRTNNFERGVNILNRVIEELPKRIIKKQENL